jgi:(heptosyl)LPS beta-1,4-glucosyltransferase
LNKLPISVVINTLNEERNLPFALGSVLPWATEVIVVDMHSEDRTREIAASLGARVFEFERHPFVEPAREFAVEQASCEWVFVLDADEVVPVGLARALAKAIEGSEAGFEIARLNFVVGESMPGKGYPDPQLRLFRKAAIEFPGVIHQNFRLREGTSLGRIPAESGMIHHFAYRTWHEYVHRMNRYTDTEARDLVASGRVRTRFKVLRNGWRAFRRAYWKDGHRASGDNGFWMALMLACYSVLTEAKAHQLRTFGDEEAVRARYETLAREMNQEYERS